MADRSKSSGSPQSYTSAQKRALSRLSVLFDLHSQLCDCKGDVISTKACASISTFLHDAASKGPQFLEDNISKLQKQVEAYQKEGQY